MVVFAALLAVVLDVVILSLWFGIVTTPLLSIVSFMVAKKYNRPHKWMAFTIVLTYPFVLTFVSLQTGLIFLGLVILTILLSGLTISWPVVVCALATYTWYVLSLGQIFPNRKSHRILASIFPALLTVFLCVEYLAPKKKEMY